MATRTIFVCTLALAGWLLSCGGGGSGALISTVPAVTLQVNPSSASLAASTTLGLSAQVVTGSATSVNWSVDGVAGGNATTGTITGTGMSIIYTAPAAAGSHTVAVASASDASVTASSLLTVQAAVTPPAGVVVSLTPTQASLLAGAAVQVQASVTGATNTAVTWTVDGVAGGNATTGTLTGTGATVTYTAPAAAGSHTLKATSAADTSKSATAVLTVTATQVPVAVTLSPSGTVGLSAQGTQSFTAAVTGSSNTAVTWTVDGVQGGNATTGNLSVSGTTASYTAPNAAGTHTVTATSVADPTRNASTTVNVAAPVVISVSLSPSGTVNLVLSATRSFTATVSGSNTTGVTWAIDGLATGTSSTGTLSGSGTTVTYTAPAAAGTHTLTAFAVADPSKSAAATIVVAAAPVVNISLSPSGTVNLASGGSQVFTGTVTGSTNTAVGWLVDGVSNGNTTVGTLVGSGSTATYTAPAAAGSHTITALASADTSKTATATVNVAAATVAISLSPSGTQSVYTSGSLSFTASVSGTTNKTVTWSVDGAQGGSSAAGTLSGSGLAVVYNAPASAGTHTVTVTSAADTSKTASVTVSVQTAPGVAVTLSTVGNSNVVPTGALLLTASVANTSNTAVTWSVDGVANGSSAAGTIFAPPVGNTVAYSAPGTTGSHQVTATSVADPSQSASLTVAVTSTLVQAGNIPVGANVKSSPYNAAGDGSTDDTSAIQAAIRAVAGTGKAVFLPAGTYLVDPTANQTGGLRLGSNMTLLLDPQAVIQAKSTSTNSYIVVSVDSCSNVNISGGTINGNNLNNTIPTPTSAEAGDCIHITRSQNVVVEGVVAQNAFNDGVYVGSNCSNITVCGITSHANRRHGMSVTYAQGVAIINSTFSANTGSVETSGGPWLNGCGIDVEANSGESIYNVVASGNHFTDNYLAGFGWGVGSTSGTTTSNVFVIGNTVSGNDRGLDGENCSNSWVLNNTVSGNASFGINIHNGSTSTLIQGNTVTNTGSSGDGAGIEVYIDSGSTVNANTSTGNAKYGVLVYKSSNEAITNNVLTGNPTPLSIQQSTGVTQSGNTP